VQTTIPNNIENNPKLAHNILLKQTSATNSTQLPGKHTNDCLITESQQHWNKQPETSPTKQTLQQQTTSTTTLKTQPKLTQHHQHIALTAIPNNIEKQPQTSTQPCLHKQTQQQ
jgi:hypothetical protein